MLNNRQFRVARPIRFIHSQLQLPAFSFTSTEWAGASYAGGTLPAAPGFNYAFKLPITPQSESFVPVIRFNIGDTYYRWRLWEIGTEIIPFGVYSGEKLYAAYPPVLEIWNVRTHRIATMSDTWYLTINRLTEPTSISDQTPVIYAST